MHRNHHVLKKVLGTYITFLLLLSSTSICGCSTPVSEERQKAIDNLAISHGWRQGDKTPTQEDLDNTPVSDEGKFASIEDIPDRSIIILYEFSKRSFRDAYYSLTHAIEKKQNQVAVQPSGVFWIPTKSDIGQEIAIDSGATQILSVVAWNGPDGSQAFSFDSWMDADDAVREAFDALVANK